MEVYASVNTSNKEGEELRRLRANVKKPVVASWRHLCSQIFIIRCSTCWSTEEPCITLSTGFWAAVTECWLLLTPHNQYQHVSWGPDISPGSFKPFFFFFLCMDFQELPMQTFAARKHLVYLMKDIAFSIPRLCTARVRLHTMADPPWFALVGVE